MNEQTLRAKARAAIANGKLPSGRPDRAWGGAGVGTPCAICGLPVDADQIELRLAFAYDGSPPGLDTFYFHVRCFAAWEFERQQE
jgi:hypothetical protein